VGKGREGKDREGKVRGQGRQVKGIEEGKRGRERKTSKKTRLLTDKRRIAGIPMTFPFS
jgi:hypothetical protein